MPKKDNKISFYLNLLLDFKEINAPSFPLLNMANNLKGLELSLPSMPFTEWHEMVKGFPSDENRENLLNKYEYQTWAIAISVSFILIILYKAEQLKPKDLKSYGKLRKELCDIIRDITDQDGDVVASVAGVQTYITMDSWGMSLLFSLFEAMPINSQTAYVAEPFQEELVKAKNMKEEDRLKLIAKGMGLSLVDGDVDVVERSVEKKEEEKEKGKDN